MSLTLTVRFTESDTLTVPLEGHGPLTDPTPLREGLAIASYHGGAALMCTLPGRYEEGRGTVGRFQGVTYVSLETSGPVVPYIGTQTLPDGRMVLIPPTQRKRQIEGFGDVHVLLGGEILCIDTETSYYTQPTQEEIDIIGGFMTERMDLTMLDHPRLAKQLSLYGDGGHEENVNPGLHDAAWLSRYWNKRMGGTPPFGYYLTAISRGTDILNNSHYDQLLYHALRYVRDGVPADWTFGVSLVMSQAMWGWEWTGKYADKPMMRYEKSDPRSDVIGGTGFPPSWAKQWIGGLVTYEALTRHPVLTWRLQQFAETLDKTKAADIWPNSEWGARIPARLIECKEIMHRAGHGDYADSVEEDIAHVVDLIDENWGVWVNRGAPKETSPWMNAELAGECLKWVKHYGVGSLHLDALLDVSEAIVEKGLIGIHNYPASYYRFPEIGGQQNTNPGDNTLLGYHVPMLRILAEFRGQWQSLYEDCRSTVGDLLGSSWGDVGRGQFPDLNDVGIMYGRKGVGYHKAALQVMGALKT